MQVTLHRTALTTQLLNEIKFTVINEQIATMQAEVKKAEQAEDWQRVWTLLERQPQLMEIRAEICKALGNRIITI